MNASTGLSPVHEGVPLRVVHERGVWRILAHAASRHEAAKQLAELSGTQLPYGVGALQSARPLHAQWEGRDLKTAWQLIIESEANYALQCGRKHCTAWILQTGPLAVAQPGLPPRVETGRRAQVQPRITRTPDNVEPSAYD